MGLSRRRVRVDISKQNPIWKHGIHAFSDPEVRRERSLRSSGTSDVNVTDLCHGRTLLSLAWPFVRLSGFPIVPTNGVAVAL